MIAKVQLTNRVELTIDERDEMETLHKAIVLTNSRQKCNECGNNAFDSFVFRSNKDKEGNVYVKKVCLKCTAESKLGQYKAGGYFWREFEKWQPKQTNGEVNKSQPRNSEEPPPPSKYEY